ncbi:MAG: 3-phenylpropionate/cinnamic acid dioxygenase subunit beta [Proteobacteria bacterium]|nr:3-phenylpropionate/cinnamic acid dioxygenase subunit beta [Pseudomonadota bacterium]
MADIAEAELRNLLLHRSVEAFLFDEADLLDRRRYKEWLDLLTDDIRYWMPLRRNLRHDQMQNEFTREGHDMAWFDEGKPLLAKRVQQIQTGIHWAEEPKSRSSHLVTNVRIVGQTATEAGTEVDVQSKFVLHRSRNDVETDTIMGQRNDRLRSIDGQWRISRREVRIDQATLLAKNLTLFF